MRPAPVMIAAAVVFAPNVHAQTTACPSSPTALQEVVHDFWTGYNKRDVAALDRVLDDDAMFIQMGGARYTKSEFLAPFRRPAGGIESTSREQLDSVRTIVAGNTAVVSFTRQGSVGFTQVGVKAPWVARMTETLICRGGRWRVLVFQETLVPNAQRALNNAAAARYDDYVGRYRFGANGDGGEIMVTRTGNTLLEAWGKDQPVELLPGKHDTFFARGFPWVERFIRDDRGRVVGIHYTLEDGELEAKRIP